MDTGNVAGLLLIIFGIALIFLRARKKGDILLTSGVWDLIGRIGDAVYIVGLVCILVGAALLDPTVVELVNPPKGGDESGMP